ncbi:dihydropyrimidine dehydrogenase [Halobaculum sp. WSA2]|uniref:Dihydropyrimidine dehydrogenase n=1 Tax=Halobaculum saliterrae TaxID=2073113 RepID=A0A6B0SUV4_9EURY|nr:dihydropyrimidine dehydrogenase [Halobaculum saliterrae]MXR42664.1 dihydropyrimidine dehydrogenase [Halobaculum saliterrae]
MDPPVALASLSGEADAEWARAGADYAGAAFLGGIALDATSREAVRAMVADRDRSEFLPEDPLAWIDEQLDSLAGDDLGLRAGVNVRATNAGAIRDAAAVCADRGAVLEVNAHCRQAELRAAGCGETLLADTGRLSGYVAAAADEGAAVSVKVRAEVDGVDLAGTARAVADAGADAIHVDAMDTEDVVGVVKDAAPELVVIANNGVRDRRTVREYLAAGADAVSVGRPSDDPRVMRRVRAAVDEWPDGEGPPDATPGTDPAGVSR